jgi:hypothetical protein
MSFFVLTSIPAHSQPIDWDAYCDDKGKTVLLLLDITTPYDEQDQKTLVSGFETLIKKLGDGDRLVIRTITDDDTHAEKLIDRCMPHCDSESFWNDLLSKCTAGVILNHRRTLLADIGRAVRNRLNSFQELDNSEIVGTIARASKETFPPGVQAELYIFSDMIENSDYIPGKTFFQERNESLLRRIERDRQLPSLNGAMVRVFGVGRGGGPGRTPLPFKSMNKLNDFWDGLLKRAGASDVKISQNLIIHQ